MWCIGALTEEYRQRMYGVLELYARPYRAHEPVICIDEKSKQLIRDSRAPLAMKRGVPAKYDYEYVRAGTCNVFVAVEPRGGRRVIEVTERRTKPEFVGFVCQLLERTYASARKVHLVLDNLNMTIMHMAFVVSALFLAYIDRVMSMTKKDKSGSA